jgi:hypothetical protein
MDDAPDLPKSPLGTLSTVSRRRIAVRFELISYAIILYIIVFAKFLSADHHDPAFMIVVLTSPAIIIPVVIVFFVIFFFILTGTTPLVSLALSVVERPLFWANLAATGITSATGLGPGLLEGVKQYLAEHNLAEIAEKDEIESNFIVYLKRSQDAARVAQRRPNALLFVGTIVAVLGLIFFVLTLPGSRYGFLNLVESPSPSAVQDLWASGIQLLPRLLMLIFIQVLAGFFLRQYRTSMEDFRYYESILRHREAQYLSYSLRKRLADKKAIMKFADVLLKEREFGLIHRGQTTTVLEAQRTEQNEFGSLYEKIAGLIARKEKEARRSASKKSEEK